MRKIFPIIIMILVFTGFLTGQIVFDYLSLEAEPQTVEINELNAYTRYYQEYFKDNVESDSRVTIVTFWASWCAPCIEELRVLQKTQEQLGQDKIRILTINGDEIDQERKIKRVVSDLDLDFEVITDDSGFYFDMYNVSALPFTLLHQNGSTQKILRTKDILDEKNFGEMLKNFLQTANL